MAVQCCMGSSPMAAHAYKHSFASLGKPQVQDVGAHPGRQPPARALRSASRCECRRTAHRWPPGAPCSALSSKPVLSRRFISLTSSASLRVLGSGVWQRTKTSGVQWWTVAVPVVQDLLSNAAIAGHRHPLLQGCLFCAGGSAAARSRDVLRRLYGGSCHASSFISHTCVSTLLFFACISAL